MSEENETIRVYLDSLSEAARCMVARGQSKSSFLEMVRKDAQICSMNTSRQGEIQSGSRMAMWRSNRTTGSNPVVHLSRHARQRERSST